MPVAKTLLALTRGRGQRVNPFHIVTAVQRPTNLDIVRMIGGEEVQVFLVDRLISYITAQTCRQSGLSSVYSELFSFEGAAIYFSEIPALASTTYGDALYRFERSTLIGLRYRDGTTYLNPPADTIIQPGDQVIVIAADDDAIQISAKTDLQIDSKVFSNNPPSSVPLDRLLILGWNRRAPMILEQIKYYAPAGSEIKIFAPNSVEQMKSDCGGMNYDAVKMTFEQGNPIDRLSLEKLVANGYHFVVILSPTESVDIQLADAFTMVTLLHLRDIANKTGRKFSIVSEIMDVRNRELMEVTSADDVIISERLIALALTQIAENKDIAPIFVDLLTSSGSEIYLKPASDYIRLDSPVNFYKIIAAAQQKVETAIGYRLLTEAGQAENSFGVHINPEKSALISFQDGDQVIVIAESG
jgi:hypothetical protein